MGVLRLKKDGAYIDIVQGPAGPIGPQGPQGPQGTQGVQGIQGTPAPTPGAWTAMTAGTNMTPADGSVNYAPACRVNGDKVELRGRYTATNTINDGDVVFTLPSGFRPAKIVVVTPAIKTSSGGTLDGVLAVNPSGTVQKIGTFSASYEMYLDGVSFSLTV